MFPPPPISTRTDTLLPYTPLFRSLPVEEFLCAVVIRGDDREEELRAFTSRCDTRGDIPLEPPPLIPLGAQGIYPVDVNLHVQPPGRFLAHVGFPPHPAPIGVDILDLGIEDVHLVEELQVHDVDDVGVRHPAFGVQLFSSSAERPVGQECELPY